MYEKFFNSGIVGNSIEPYDSYAFESRETFTNREINQFEVLDKFYPVKTISLEDDNPFGDIGADDGGDTFGDDTADDNPFGDIGDGLGDTSGGDAFSDDGGFDFDSAADDGGDIFGDSGDGEAEAEKAKQKALLLDRAKSIKEDFDISRQIRANFPKKYLEIKDAIQTNIRKIERTVLDKVEYEDVLQGIVKEYERMYELIEAYIGVMAKKPYDDIFATYVSIHTNLLRLKNLYIKIAGLDKKFIEQEESKYSDTI